MINYCRWGLSLHTSTKFPRPLGTIPVRFRWNSSWNSRWNLMKFRWNSGEVSRCTLQPTSIGQVVKMCQTITTYYNRLQHMTKCGNACALEATSTKQNLSQPTSRDPPREFPGDVEATNLSREKLILQGRLGVRPISLLTLWISEGFTQA